MVKNLTKKNNRKDLTKTANFLIENNQNLTHSFKNDKNARKI
jgi:hypothetical protein